VAKRYIAIHLIVTPEYLKNVLSAHEDVDIFALRVDRGLSDEKVLKTIPGEMWELEKGLNSHDYIVPGAGGLGELLNNSFV
jgi:uracil phosphoribosyltransferase